jgi:hypothetical protein
VTVRYGLPMRWEPEPGASRERQHRVADDVLASVRALHHDLAAGKP